MTKDVPYDACRHFDYTPISATVSLFRCTIQSNANKQSTGASQRKPEGHLLAMWNSLQIGLCNDGSRRGDAVDGAHRVLAGLAVVRG